MCLAEGMLPHGSCGLRGSPPFFSSVVFFFFHSYYTLFQWQIRNKNEKKKKESKGKVGKGKLSNRERVRIFNKKEVKSISASSKRI